MQPRVTAGERGALWLTELRLPGARPIAAAKGDTFLTLLEPPNSGFGVFTESRVPSAGSAVGSVTARVSSSHQKLTKLFPWARVYLPAWRS